MSKEVEEAKKYLRMMNNDIDFNLLGYVYANESIETILNELDKRIPIEKIEEIMEESEE